MNYPGIYINSHDSFPHFMAPKSSVYNLPVFYFSRADQTVRQLGTAQESVQKYTKVNLREYLPEL